MFTRLPVLSSAIISPVSIISLYGSCGEKSKELIEGKTRSSGTLVFCDTR